MSGHRNTPGDHGEDDEHFSPDHHRAGTRRRRRRTPKRRRYSVAEKRQIVEESFEPGTSVARVARAHGVNANQVFTWRRLYQRGQLGGNVPSDTPPSCYR